MKNTVILLIFIFGNFVFSQNRISKNSDLLVTYSLDFKKFLASESSVNENLVLIINDAGSLFTFETMMNLNEIQKMREITNEEVILYKSSYYFLIKNDGKETVHYEALGNDSFKFSEIINTNWKLIDQDTLINGYRCKKATINHLGRKWIAWYNTEVPVSFGPYKFYGLPGLIMSLKDSDDIFIFNVIEIKTGSFEISADVKKYFINEEDRPFESLKSNDFYALRTRFYQMTLNEKLNYMNRENGAKHNFKITNTNGDDPRMNSKPKVRNFFEHQ